MKLNIYNQKAGRIESKNNLRESVMGVMSKLLPLAMAGFLIGLPQAKASDDRTGILIGVDARQNSWYGYAGVTQHFGKNVYDDGVIGRLVGFGGQYSYTSPAVAQGRVDADYSALEALVGYQKVLPAVTLRFYAGAEYEGNSLSPANPYDGNSGQHYGAKVRFDAETDFAAPNYGNLIATYGTARDRYWIRARGGRDFSGFVVGPELMATGDVYAHEERYGAFLYVRRLLPVALTFSVGQARTPANSASVTGYATAEFSMSF